MVFRLMLDFDILILILAGIFAILLLALKFRDFIPSGTVKKLNDHQKISPNIPKYPHEQILHRKQEYLCTENERKLFFCLRKALDDRYLVHCQTSLIALVEPLLFKNKSKAWSKRIDFVITDTATKIIAVIELDDSSHQQRKRIIRDKYVHDALSPHHAFIRIATEQFYDPSIIANALEVQAGIPNRFEHFNKHTASA